MSMISDSLKKAVKTIAEAEGGVLVEYDLSGTFTAIPGAVWHERNNTPEQDFERTSEYYIRSASLTIANDGPSLAYRTKVRVAGDVFEVVADETLANHKRYSLTRREKLRSTPDRASI